MNVQFKHQFLAVAAGLLLAGAANASQVQTRSDTAPKKPEFSRLSTAQLEKLTALKDKFNLDTAAEKAQLKADRHELFDLLSKPTVDKEQVLSLNTKMNTLKNQISDARINLLLASSEVLTPQQKEQMHDRFLLRSLKGGRQHHKFGCARGKGSCFGKQSMSKASTNG